jgi:Zn-dependent M28 family amino/carboxypeptidase
MRMAYRVAAILLAATSIWSAAASAQPAIDTLALRGHTRFLADDLLLGRGTGTQGERLAAAYIASQAERLGLTPVAGAGSFLLPLPLLRAHIDPASQLVLQTGRDSVVYSHGSDFIVNTGGRGAFRDFRGRAVFMGPAVHAAALVQRERSLAGRVAVFAGPLGASALELIPALSHAGAAGVVLLIPDAAQFDLYVRSRGPTRYLVDAGVDDPVWQPTLPVLIAGPEFTDALLDGVAVPGALIEGGAEAALDLGRTIVARITASLEEVAAANVAAVLPGTDPAHRERYVAYTAHYDHLGVSTPDASGDSIYNGFSDNAAGVAMLLAIAESLRAAPPPHSTLFIFLTGEERGLLGSSYMASAPPLPLDRIIALINLDAGAPPAPPVSWRIAGGDSPLGRISDRVAAARGWTTLAGAATPNSDHWPFLRRGVPSLFIIPGDDWQGTSPEERDALRWRWDRYHQPGDHWHPEFPFAGLARYAEFALLVGLEAARNP